MNNFFLLLIIEVRKDRNESILCGCNTLEAKINEIIDFYMLQRKLPMAWGVPQQTKKP